MGARRIHKVFSVDLNGKRQPINVTYRLYLPTHIEFDTESGTRMFPLIAIIVNVREEETAYLIGDEIFGNSPREKNKLYNEEIV